MDASRAYRLAPVPMSGGGFGVGWGVGCGLGWGFGCGLGFGAVGAGADALAGGGALAEGVADGAGFGCSTIVGFQASVEWHSLHTCEKRA